MKAWLLREGDHTRILAPWVPDFVADLKATIPYHGKRFDGESRNWLIEDEYEEAAVEIAGRYFEITVLVTEAEALRRERAAAASSARPAHNAQQCLSEVRRIWSEEAALQVLPDAAPSVVHAAYRALALLLHPDMGGSHASMVEVNRAYDLLKKRGKA